MHDTCVLDSCMCMSSFVAQNNRSLLPAICLVFQSQFAPAMAQKRKTDSMEGVIDRSGADRQSSYCDNCKQGDRQIKISLFDGRCCTDMIVCNDCNKTFWRWPKKQRNSLSIENEGKEEKASSSNEGQASSSNE